MSKLYTITKKIHDNLQKVCEKYGLEKLEIESDYTLHEYSGYVDSESLTEYRKYHKKEYHYDMNRDLLNCDFYADRSVIISPPLFASIEPPQIRQILKHLQGVLGENPDYTEMKKSIEASKLFTKDRRFSDYFIISESLFLNHLPMHKTLSQALCRKWLNYRKDYTCMIDSEPEKVFEELNQILESKLK